MNETLSKIWHSPSVRNVGKLLSASIVAQAVGILVYPILSRLYSPEDFGLLNLFLSIGGVLLILSTAQYQYAVSVTAKEKDAKGAFHAGLLCLIATGALWCMLPLFAAPVAQLFKAPALADYIWLMPIYVCSLGLWQLLNNWYNRRKAFGNISRYQVAQSLLSAGSKLGLGYSAVAGGLLYGSVGAAAFASLGSLVVGWRKQLAQLWPCDRNEIKQAFKRFRKYPLFAMPAALVNAVNCNIAVWLITPLFGLEMTGYFGMAMLLGYMPISLIAESLYQVLLQHVSVKVNTHQPVRDLFRRYIRRCAVIVIPFFSLLYILMPWLVKIMLGDGWEETASMLRVFLPWFALFCFSLPWGFLPMLFEKQHINLWIEVTLLLLRLAVLGIGGYLHNLTLAIIAYSAVSGVVLLAQLVWYGRLVCRHDRACQPLEA